jgi:hypothetical protein
LRIISSEPIVALFDDVSGGTGTTTVTAPSGDVPGDGAADGNDGVDSDGSDSRGKNIGGDGSTSGGTVDDVATVTTTSGATTSGTTSGASSDTPTGLYG